MRKLPWKTLLLAFAAGATGLVVVCAGVTGPCWSRWAADGVLLDQCPVGAVRTVATVEAYGLGRKDEGVVTVGVTGHYVDRWGGFGTTPVRRFSPALALVGADGVEHALVPEDGWDGFQHRASATVTLPDVPDGDYTLRVTVDSPAGPATVEAPVALYQPALAHVLTDAPLYKPGQDVKFRGVLLGAGDLAPLEGRPAVWRVYDPQGELLLEEKATTSAFGVVRGSFPLASDAESGAWQVELRSGQASDRVGVDVKPFQLPRFTVEASSGRPYWRVGETPVVTGIARYTSGAPVSDAPIRVTMRASGAWPPPREWEAARTLRTDAKGAFSFEVGMVPADLRGQATLQYTVEATDETGDTVTGGASVLLSEDALAADAVTELAGGLVASANNRVYVRVTTPDGRILPGATVRVSRDWDPADPGLVTTADADGVARFQLDPGEPITVVAPEMPVRPAPRAEVVAATLMAAEDELTDTAVDLEGQVALDRWTALVRACAVQVPHGETKSVEASVLLGGDGRVRVATALVDGARTALARCVADRLSGQAGPRGRDRLWSVQWSVRDPGTPWVDADVEGHVGELGGFRQAIEDRLAEARACVVAVEEPAALPRAWRVAVAEGSTAVALTPLADPSVGGRVDAGVAACVERVVAGTALPEPSLTSGVGRLRLSVGVPTEARDGRAEPVTFPGFALRVAASRGDEEIGATVLRLPVGAVPDLRLRFSEVVVDAGAAIELTAVRGPDFSGAFPEKMRLMQGGRQLAAFDFDPEARRGLVNVPKDASGFAHVEWGGARAVLYVRPKATLALTVTPDAPTYRPGGTARLTVTAKDGDAPVAAGVTLSGVDSTLATLAPLPNADAFARVTVRATSDTPAFGVLDARALQTGQIAGENAAQAAVLRVTGLPDVAPGADRVAIAETRGTFTPDAELSDAFYTLYRDARAEVRAWEAAAPAGEVLTAKQMVALWEKALAAHPAADPFGRPLHLSVLPSDLLALTDPRFMASDGARLPEDVENWTRFVAAEAP
ncbi:MAG: MG2 domain-containing protein [Myxococcota bacterium]